MRKVFLTGPVNAGKSTVVKTAVSQVQAWGMRVAGFYTLPYVERGSLKGFYMKPATTCVKLPGVEDRLIAYTDGSRWYPVVKTFEELGVQILEHSLGDDSGLVVMDELGFFEAKAYSFQQKVIEVLSSSKPVIGVIKPLSIPFLDSIRKRGDVTVIEVTPANRDRLPYEIIGVFKEEMGL